MPSRSNQEVQWTYQYAEIAVVDPDQGTDNPRREDSTRVDHDDWLSRGRLFMQIIAKKWIKWRNYSDLMETTFTSHTGVSYTTVMLRGIWKQFILQLASC